MAEALLEEGIYRNQFETGISAGGLSAFPGGPRDTWERTLFGGAYHTEDVTDSERPKYGALELVRYSDGPIPRFGSCYLVLQPRVTRRTSFTFAGSEDPRAIVFARPLANLVLVPVGAAIAVGASAVVFLEELLVLALQILFEDDTRPCREDIHFRSAR